jgi:hypothetical protein
MTDLLGEDDWKIEPWQIYIQVEPVRNCAFPLMNLLNLPESQSVEPVDLGNISSLMIFHQLLISVVLLVGPPLPTVPFRLRLLETRSELSFALTDLLLYRDVCEVFAGLASVFYSQLMLLSPCLPFWGEQTHCRPADWNRSARTSDVPYRECQLRAEQERVVRDR